jgi:hypothetical protein
MKGSFLKFLLGFMLCFGVEGQMVDDKFDAMVNQTLEECRLRENASIEEMMILYQDDDSWPKTHEGKCLLECFFEEIGIVRKE